MQDGVSRIITVGYMCSVLIVLYSLSMIPPILLGLVYREKDIYAFLVTFGLAIAFGAVGWITTQRGAKSLRTKDGFLVAVLFWLILSVVSAGPLIMDPRLDLTLTNAIFESVSGITTTGASVLENIDTLPRSILYYRAQLNFLGGLGIIVLAVAILPLLGIGGAKLYQSEMPGPLKEEKLTPRLADTAKQLWLIYLGLAFLCGLGYFAAGMGYFDALCHSLSTVSLGGFSTKTASLGHYDSHAIELVGGFFSMCSAISFPLYFAALYRRRLSPILRDSEFRFFIVVLALIVTFTAIALYQINTFSAFDSIVHSFFQVTSVMTDNGLTTSSFSLWPAHIVLPLLISSFFGGCVGSTCGGIKAMRFLLLFRGCNQEVAQLIHPNAILSTKVGSKAISDRIMRSVSSLFFVYILFACIFVWGLVLCGHDVMTAFGTVAASINNMGVGYGETASGFGSLRDSAKWLTCAAMLFGRLEIFPILVVFSKAFWRF